MCGIVSAVSLAANIVPILIESLRKLEYRGYDSARIAVLNGAGVQRVRTASRSPAFTVWSRSRANTATVARCLTPTNSSSPSRYPFETADTPAALRHAKDLGHTRTLAICNVPESAIVRECALRVITRAGPEIGVAPTKAFSTQLAVLFLLTLVVGKERRSELAAKFAFASASSGQLCREMIKNQGLTAITQGESRTGNPGSPRLKRQEPWKGRLASH